MLKDSLIDYMVSVCVNEFFAVAFRSFKSIAFEHAAFAILECVLARVLDDVSGHCCVSELACRVAFRNAVFAFAFRPSIA